MFKLIQHFIDLVREIKKTNIHFTENNTLNKQLLQAQQETNEKLDRVANLEAEFLGRLTSFISKREKKMIEETEREALRDEESKPTKWDNLM